MTPRTADEWAAAVRSELAGLAGAATLAGTVQIDVTGGPAGDAAVHATLEGGRVSDLGAGPAEGPDATLALTATDARLVLAGELDPSVAFMQGRMKVVGDMGLVIDLLALSAGDTARDCRRRLADLAAS